jgi:hypothetical protein
MNKRATFKFIADRQRHWAETQRLAVHVNGRVSRLEDNLFAPLHVETRAEFEAGDGDEFGSQDAVGNIHSLYSSSALVCNVFDYWRDRPMSPLLRACGIDDTYTHLKFERKFLTGVGSRPANLDLLIADTDASGWPVAIESKFTEPFQTGERDCLRPAYFRNSKVWGGLPTCREIAESLAVEERFKYLKVGQLLKHTLGLTRTFGKKKFALLYLWYDVNGSDAAEEHRDEVQEFGSLVANEVLFRSDTYQNIFGRLSPLTFGSLYEKYLRSRYFE